MTKLITFLYVSISSTPGDQTTLKQVKFNGKIRQPVTNKFLIIQKININITKKIIFVFPYKLLSFQKLYKYNLC